MTSQVLCTCLVLAAAVSLAAAQVNGSSIHDCPPGWHYFGGSCYLFTDYDKFSWSGAAQYCAVRHSHLAVIDNNEESTFLQNRALGLFNQIQATICHFRRAYLTCPVGKVLRITNVFYGRLPNAVPALCNPYSLNVADAYCRGGPSATGYVERLCNGKQACLVINHWTSFGTDPCPRIAKYLQVTHQCVDPTPTPRTDRSMTTMRPTTGSLLTTTPSTAVSVSDSSSSFWTGAIYESDESVWTWYTDNRDIGYTNWWPGQPRSRDDIDTYCMILYGQTSFNWNGADCRARFLPLCERKSLTSTPIVG